MSNKSTARRKRPILEDAAFGFVLGALFPIVSTVISMVSLDLVPSVKAAVLVHRTEPLLQVIDTMPFILLVAFALVGRSRRQLDTLIAELEARVEQRTAALESARVDAERDEQRRNRLLARSAGEMANRIETIIDTPMSEQSPWSWEPLLELTQRLADLATLAAGEISDEPRSFAAESLVANVRGRVKDPSRPGANITTRVAPDTPTELEGKPQLLTSLLASAAELISGLAPSGTTTLELTPRWGKPHVVDGLYLRCTNDRAKASIDTLRDVLAGRDLSKEIDAVRELTAVSLRTSAAALQAEIALRVSDDDGTVLSIAVPLTPTVVASREADGDDPDEDALPVAS